ncbi:hypothetical protein EJP69_13505 [Variovorax gossypii]|uniref:Uncharacterized protein n=1 Tax=Variovorax gossypii TaxID=1679495 RepID=A0A431TNR8_9BURK|nr:hypothetical protein [Variovorax gossypii]RTQ35387.1 hypothetical protein EJP69_13505 [Variovorax gossypii]
MKFEEFRKGMMPRSAMALALTLVLSGCASINGVSLLPQGGEPRRGQAVLVYGIQAQGEWTAPRWGVSLDEYDIEKERITGNCWRFNRTTADVASVASGVQYFAFNVPAGHYVFSGFNLPQVKAPLAFVVPQGRTVFAGTFVYTNEGQVEIRRDVEVARQLIQEQLPGVSREIEIAATKSLSVAPRAFLCGP